MTTVTLSGLRTTITTGGAPDQVLMQPGDALGDAWVEGGKVVKVVAADGIVFAGAWTTLIRPAGFNVTDMCDLHALAKRIDNQQEEQGALYLHLHAA